MKEIRNLATKNDCFGELNYDEMTDEMKKNALPLLIFMVMKQNREIKSRSIANGSYQRTCTDKNEVSSPTPDFFSIKYTCAVAAKEKRDIGTVDLPGFFL